MAVAADAFFIAHGFGNGLTNGDANVFHWVVIVDMGVAVAGDVQVDHAMAGDLIHHMFKKGHAGVKHAFTGAIEVEADVDFGFQGIARHTGNPLVGCSRVSARGWIGHKYTRQGAGWKDARII